MAIFFEWNQTDLSQFGSPIVGPSVTSSSVSVVSDGGLNWVEINVTGDKVGTSPTYDAYSSVILPIGVVAPRDSVFLADCHAVNTDHTSYVGYGIVSRCSSINTGYIHYRYFSANLVVFKMGGTEAGPMLSSMGFGDSDSEPDYGGNNKHGERLGMNVYGNVWVGAIHMEGQAMHLDWEDPHTSGTFGLMATMAPGGESGDDAIMRFRCITGYVEND